jgi:peptidoglycan/LPS O-acetylase OafA/YrhL
MVQGSLTTGQKVPYLDGWRGFAILCVLYNHFGPGSLSSVGEFGVLLFFVLSGHFMSQLLFVRRLDLSTFFVRRFSRVLPTFGLFVLAMAVYSATVQPQPYHASLGELVSTFTFLRTYLPVDLSIWAEKWPIGHIWSLNVEEHSYAYLALGAFLCAKAGSADTQTIRRWTWFGGAVLALVFTVSLFWDVDEHAYVFLALGAVLWPKVGAKDEGAGARWFLVGSTVVVLGTIFYYLIRPPSGASPWYLRSECASLGLLASAAYRVVRQGHQKPRGGAYSLLPVGALVLSALFFAPFIPYCGLLSHTVSPLLAAYSINRFQDVPSMFHSALSTGVLRWFGVCSFSIYLWQQSFYLLVKQQGAPPFVCLVGAVVLGSLSFYLFENPVRLYVNRRWERHRRNADSALGGTSR